MQKKDIALEKLLAFVLYFEYSLIKACDAKPRKISEVEFEEYVRLLIPTIKSMTNIIIIDLITNFFSLLYFSIDISPDILFTFNYL